MQHNPIARALGTAIVMAARVAADCPLQEIGQWGGGVGQIEYRAGYAYAAVGAKLVVLDVSDITHPNRVGQWVSSRWFGTFSLGDSHAYVLDNGLHVIDISNPAAPHEVGYYADADTRATVYDGPQFWQGYVYAAMDDPNDLMVIDVSQPARPVLAARVPIGRQFRLATIIDGYAYVVVRHRTLEIWDLAEPTLPRVVGQQTYTRDVRSIAVTSGYAYVSILGQPVSVLDVRDPAALHTVGSLNETENSVVRVGDGFLITAVERLGWYSVRVFLLQDPARPEFLGTMPTAESSPSMAIGDERLVMTLAGGIAVVTLELPNIPRLAGRYFDVGGVYEGNTMATDGRYAYVADWLFGLKVVDLGTPQGARVTGVFELPQNCEYGYCAADQALSLAYQDGYVYLLSQLSGTYILDVNDPHQPRVVAIYDGHEDAIAVEPGLLYLLAPPGLRVLDVTNPAAPTVIGEASFPNGSRQIFATPGYVFVCSDNAIRIVDVSNPSAPAVVGTIDYHEWVSGLDVHGSTVYVASHSSDFRTFDISNPAHPVAGWVNHFGSTYDVKFVGDIAYLATWWWGLRVVDFSDPRFPREINRQDMPRYSNGVAVAGDTALVANAGYGISVIDVLPQVGDLDSDGDVDVTDLTRLLSRFGTFAGGGAVHGDLNCDGWVDVDDLTLLLSAFGSAR